MTQEDGTQGGLPTLVDLTYSATTDPGRYEELVQVWEQYMSGLSPGDIEDAQQHHLRHFNQALEIFERIGRQKHRQDRADMVVELFEVPAYVIDRNGGVVQANKVGGAGPLAIPSDALEQRDMAGELDPAALKAAIVDIQQGASVALIPVHDSEDRLTDCAVVTALEEGQAEGDRFLVVSSGPSVNENQLASLKLRFNLSSSETEVFAALLRGETVAGISERRGVGLATTRTQVRKLLEKTNSPTLADLIRQATLINAQITAVGLAQKLTATENADAVSYDRILTSDGRLMAYRDFGAPDGRPVLFIHNMIGGAIWTQEMEQLARAKGWRIIAPSRPGFGLSDSYPARDMELVRKTCSDMRALLDHLMIDRVLVIGMISSAGVGIRFAKDHSDRVVGLLNVSHAGVVDDELIDAMANPSRAMAKTYRKSPTALRFLIRVAVASVDLLGPTQMLRSNFRRSAPDTVLFEDKKLVDAIGQGLQHAIAQGGEAFSRDGFVSLNDFSDDLRSLTCRAVCLMGREDAMYPTAHALRLMEKLPEYEAVVFENAGQFVFYGRFSEVLDVMEGIWEDGSQVLPVSG
jgi:pimeloyl-ACP methyl ester carboxylesterase